MSTKKGPTILTSSPKAAKLNLKCALQKNPITLKRDLHHCNSHHQIGRRQAERIGVANPILADRLPSNEQAGVGDGGGEE